MGTRGESTMGYTNSINSEELRIVVLGSSGVGKSTLIAQFLEDQFIEKYRGTFEIISSRDYDDEGRHLSVDIVEISQGDAVPTLRRQSIEHGDAFILLYSIDDKDSFEDLYSLRDIILDIKNGEKVPIYIVANKLDMDGTRATPVWQVADAVATIDWEHGYMEVSARDRDQVADLFREVVRLTKATYKARFEPLRRMTNPAAFMARIKKRLAMKRKSSLN